MTIVSIPRVSRAKNEPTEGKCRRGRVLVSFRRSTTSGEPHNANDFGRLRRHTGVSQ